jgi:hypothetical protein
VEKNNTFLVPFSVFRTGRHWYSTPTLFFSTYPNIYIYIYINFFLGFFNYKNKKYGAFFCAVQTFSKTVFAIPIKDLKSDTLIKALEAMSKVLPLPPPLHHSQQIKK